MKIKRKNVPASITRAQYIKALKAFHKAIGSDPGSVYFPTILTDDTIYLNMVVPDNSGRKMLAHPQIGNGGSVAAAHTRIHIDDEVQG